MPRQTLDRHINHLLEQLLLLGSMVENAAIQSTAALLNHDKEHARLLYAADAQINEKRFEIENTCIATIATQQPIMAHDLRLLVSILDVASEIERMGDYAKGIAKICTLADDHIDTSALREIKQMAEIVADMLHRALGAFVKGDVAVAQSIPPEDDRVDDFYNRVYQQVTEQVHNGSLDVTQSNHILWAAHNIERMADRVTNLCERTIYHQTGKMKEIKASDDE